MTMSAERRLRERSRNFIAKLATSSRGCMRKESFHPSKGLTPCSDERCHGVGVSGQPPFGPRRLTWPADRMIRHDLALKTWRREAGDDRAFSV
jgi:hypothetical protein